MLHVLTPVQSGRCGVYAIVIPQPSWSKPTLYIGLTTRSFIERLREHRRLLEQGEHPNDVLQTCWNAGLPMVVGELIGFPLTHHDPDWVAEYCSRVEVALITYAQYCGYTIANEQHNKTIARATTKNRARRNASLRNT